jgi:hypothetical protein
MAPALRANPEPITVCDEPSESRNLDPVAVRAMP